MSVEPEDEIAAIPREPDYGVALDVRTGGGNGAGRAGGASTAEAHAGTAESHAGTAEAHDGTAVAHDGTAVAHDGTAEAHAGTAVAHAGTAEAQGGAVRADGVRADGMPTEDVATEDVQAEPVVISAPDVAPIAMTSPTAEAVTWPIRIASEWAARLLVIAAGLYVLLIVLDKVSLVAFAFVLALFFASVLHPVERRLRSIMGGRKSASSAVVLLGGILVFGLVGWFVEAQISSHASELSSQVDQVGTNLQNWLRDGPLKLRDTNLNSSTTSLSQTIKDHQGELLSGAVTTATVLAEVVGAALLALLGTFFLIRDGEQIWNFALRLLPRAAHRRVDVAGHRGWHTLSGYIRGQVTIAFIHAISISVALLILRVPLAAALGVVVFLGSFVPILGLTVAGALCIGVTLLEHGVTAAVIIAAVIIFLVQAEGNLLQPLIMSRAVHIHPLAVAFAVAAGTTLYGVVGALVAVPLVAFTNSFIRALREEPVDPVTEDVPGT